MDSRYLHNLPHPCRLRPLASLSLTWPFGPPSPEGLIYAHIFCETPTITNTRQTLDAPQQRNRTWRTFGAITLPAAQSRNEPTRPGKFPHTMRIVLLVGVAFELPL